MELDTKVVFACDLCISEGEPKPKCIEWCSTEALELNDKKAFREKVHALIEKNGLSQLPEVKRWL